MRFVDTASDLAAAREEYGISMFPRGGIHWNSLATALGTQKVIAAVNAQRSDPLLATLSFTWRISYHPQGVDRDLLDIMNLRHPDTNYPVPELTYQSTPPPGGCHTTTITEVGGSFLRNLNSTLEKLACPPNITTGSTGSRGTSTMPAVACMSCRWTRMRAACPCSTPT